MLINTKTPRLNTHMLPMLDYGDYVDSMFTSVAVRHATSKGANNLLSTKTRYAIIAGPPLQIAHKLIGLYLATEYLTEVIGLKTYEVEHVQGKKTEGHRLHEEKNTLIVPLMRGGEPLAQGIWDAFPQARFCHAKRPTDVSKQVLETSSTILLVDYVVNSGKSICEFVELIRSFFPQIRIVVVAGVIQADAVKPSSLLARTIRRYGHFVVVAMRLSEIKYTGTGTTDTGNRLFNTTFLE